MGWDGMGCNVFFFSFFPSQKQLITAYTSILLL
jgi:hypothetical protein